MVPPDQFSLKKLVHSRTKIFRGGPIFNEKIGPLDQNFMENWSPGPKFQRTNFPVKAHQRPPASLGVATTTMGTSARTRLPFLGEMFLLVVDAHSKWLKVAIVNSATSTNTIDNLRMMFSTHGLPEVIVSDNGTAFSSEEFSEFTCRNSIRHFRTPPYHPSSNRQV